MNVNTFKPLLHPLIPILLQPSLQLTNIYKRKTHKTSAPS